MHNSKSSKFNSWIFDSYHLSFEELGLFRIFAALFLLLFALPSTATYQFLGSLPGEFFNPPPGPMQLFNSFPSEAIFLLFHYALIVCLILLLFGFSTKIVSITGAILLLVLKGFIYSLGKINHDILLIVVPLVMAFSGWGRAYSVDALRKTRRHLTPQNWTLTLLALIIGFMFFTAGIPKIWGGWLDLQTQATQGHLYREFFVHGRRALLAPVALSFSDFIWELLDYATILFEVGFLVAVIHPRCTRIFISIAVVFHFSVIMLMNISFLPNFIAYAAFLNWGFINRNIKKIGDKFTLPQTEKNLLPPLFVAAFMYFIATIIPFIKNNLNSETYFSVEGAVIISAATLIAVYYLVKQLVRLFID